MALDPLQIIAGPESSFGTNLYNPTSSATGIWQDIQSTWQEASAAIGYKGVYPNAASAPPSVQAAANAWLYNQRGFEPWTIGDPVLAQEIAAAGGPGAFAAPGTLSTNPADYAYLDQPGGLAAYFNGQAPNASSGFVAPSSLYAGTPGVSGNNSMLSSPFYPEAGLVSEYTSPWLGGTYNPSTGAFTPVSGSGIPTSGSGTAPAGGSAVNPGSTQSWWQTLISGITAELERVGIMIFGVLLVIAAAYVLMQPHVQNTLKKAFA